MGKVYIVLWCIMPLANSDIASPYLVALEQFPLEWIMQYPTSSKHTLPQQNINEIHVNVNRMKIALLHHFPKGTSFPFSDSLFQVQLLLIIFLHGQRPHPSFHHKWLKNLQRGLEDCWGRQIWWRLPGLSHQMGIQSAQTHQQMWELLLSCGLQGRGTVRLAIQDIGCLHLSGEWWLISIWHVCSDLALSVFLTFSVNLSVQQSLTTFPIFLSVVILQTRNSEI